MNTLRTTFKRLIEWFRTPPVPYNEISEELHLERELRRGMVGDAGG
jgi:hypothetical protein